jgi:hypothetical protein
MNKIACARVCSWLPPTFVTRCFMPALVALLLPIAGCEDDSPVCPESGPAILRGQILGGGVGVPASIVAIRPDYSRRDSYFSVDSDSSGRYELHTPPGQYQIRIATRSLWFFGSDMEKRVGGLRGAGADAETISLGPGTRDLDFAGGRVTAAIGIPPELSGASLRCLLKGRYSSTSIEAVAGSDSAFFEFALVPEGEYVVGIGRSTSELPFLWLPNSAWSGEGPRFEVPVNRQRRIEGGIPPPARISGSVRGSWQVSAPYRPSIAAVAGDQTLALTEPEDDGSFRMELFVAEPVRIRVRIGGIERWIGDEEQPNGMVYHPQLGEEITGASLVESGILCRLEGPRYLTHHDGSLSIYDMEGREIDSSPTYNNPLGFSNLRPGTYFLSIRPYSNEPWLPQWFDGADSLSVATPIVIQGEGESVPVTFHLVEGGRIQGTIVRPDGSAGHDSYLEITAVAGDPHGYPGHDSWPDLGSGFFEIKGLPDGNYYLRTVIYDGDSHETWLYPGTASVDSAETIGVHEHGMVGGIIWKVPERPPSGEAIR